jgi:hypothetical protein
MIFTAAGEDNVIGTGIDGRYSACMALQHVQALASMSIP